MKILITGPQGSGKTTQAEILAKHLNLPFVGAGDLLREFAKGRSEESVKVRQDLAAGRFVDDNVLAKLMSQNLAQSRFQNGFVADGYPRSFSQLKVFDPKFDQVFYLEISDEEAEERLLRRGREDDTAEVIKERWRWYHRETDPILDYYQKLGILVVIDAGRSIEEVTREIEAKLGS